MFQYDSIDDEPNKTFGLMQWSTQMQQQRQSQQGGKSIESNWLHQHLRLQPLSEQPFDFSDTNTSVASEATDIHSTDTSISRQQHPQPSLLTLPELEDLEMEMEEEDLWASETAMRRPIKTNTLSWDTRNSQFPSYEQTQLSERNIGTPFITEVPHSLFEPLIRRLQDSSCTVVIYETELVKSLIQAITGLPSIYFYWNQQDHSFRQRSTNYRILGVSTTAVQPVLCQILLFGTRIKALENVSQQCQQQPNTFGLTGVAFGCCLQELITYIQHTIMTVFSSDHHGSESMTILKVHHSIHSLATVVEKLHGFCQIQNQKFELPKGAALLNLLHREISEFDLASNGGNSALYRDICLVILRYASVPYSNMMSRWLHLHSNHSDGQHGDPYSEFFIGERASTSQNDLLQRYLIRSETDMPYFVGKELGLYILRSGISVRLLKLAKPDHPLFDLNDSISLKCTINNAEYEEYMSKLQRACDYIKSYNTTGDVHTNDQYNDNDDDDNDDDHQANQNTTQHDIPTLPPLGTKQSDFSHHLLQVLHDETKHSIPTLDTITRQSYIGPIQTWCRLLNESFMISFLDQFKLQSHLSLLYRYFLFGNGAFVNSLKATLFSSGIGLNHVGNCWPPKSFELNLALRNVLLENAEHEYDDLVTFSIRKTTANSQWNHPDAVEAFNFLQLNYDATYPLNMVITPNSLDKYNRIFTFLLQLLRVATVIKRCYEPLRNMKWHRPSARDILYKYRFQMDQFTSALQSYIHDTAIKASWSSFMQHVQAMQTRQPPSSSSSKDYVSVIMEPHSFRDYHEHVLDRILFQCFLKQSQTRIFQVLQPVLEDIIFFSAILDDYEAKNVEDEDTLIVKCCRIFEQFQKHAQVFVKVLQLLETKGSGRLTNILNSTRHSIFNDLYARHEAKNGMDVFVQDLLTRFVLNGYYL